MKVGLVFKTEEEAVSTIENWCRKTFCPLTKVRRQQPSERNGKRIRGQRGYKCAHGVERKSRSKDEQRPYQRIKFTGCPVKLNINEQEDGTWMVTSSISEHVNHESSE